MIRRLWIAVTLAAVTAWADGPADYRSSAAVTPTGNDALQRLTLPFEAYRDTRRDLADLRIFNAAGEALPLAFALDPESETEPPVGAALPLFPVYGAAGTRGPADLDLTVRTNRDGSLVSLKTRVISPPLQRPVAWLLDASQLKRPIGNLVVDWDAGRGTELARVTVEASDDLKSWRSVASRAPLLRVEQGGQSLAQRKVDMGGVRAKYLRITGEPVAFVLRGVRAESPTVLRPAARLTRIVPSTPGAKPGEYSFDLGAHLPVEAVRVLLGAPNSVAPFTIARRESPGGEPRLVAVATFYRLVREGVELQSPSLEIGRLPARYWSILLDPRSPPLGSAPPSLEVQWRPARVVFVARGEAPFALAFGKPDATRAQLAVSELIPGYERHAEFKLPEAKLGEVRSSPGGGGWRARIVGDASPRKIALWVILVLAVAALAWMAWRLERQLRAGRPPT